MNKISNADTAHQLRAGAREIRRLREQIAFLHPRAQAYDVLAHAVSMSMRQGGEAMSICPAYEMDYEMDRMADAFENEEKEESADGQSDVSASRINPCTS